MNEFPLLLISFVIYLLVMLTGFASFFGSKTKWTRISYWLAMAGLIEEIYRLPLCEMRPENEKKLAEVLKKLGVLK